MAFETIYLIRESVKDTQKEIVQITIESLRKVIFQELLEEDNIAIYPTIENLDEDLKTLEKLSFLTINDGKIIINREAFLNATKFVERQEELLKGDRYATAIFEKLKQRAKHIQLL